MFMLDGLGKQTSWEEGQEDNTKWEVLRFLQLATKCNPTILEVFAAPVRSEGSNGWGQQLRALFPHIWEPKLVRDAFIGYGLNQRKKFLEDKDGRKNKYATAYVRTLAQAEHLLKTGELLVNMEQHPVVEKLKRFRAGEYEMGEVIDVCMAYQKRVEEAVAACKQKQSLDPVNTFLTDIRISYLSPR